MNADAFLTRFAERAGIEPPTADDIAVLLDLAGVAAHSSERVAAPITCWLAAKAGLTPEEAYAIANDIGDDE